MSLPPAADRPADRSPRRAGGGQLTPPPSPSLPRRRHHPPACQRSSAAAHRGGAFPALSRPQPRHCGPRAGALIALHSVWRPPASAGAHRRLPTKCDPRRQVYKGRRKCTGQITAMKFILKHGKSEKDIRSLRQARTRARLRCPGCRRRWAARGSAAAARRASPPQRQPQRLRLQPHASPLPSLARTRPARSPASLPSLTLEPCLTHQTHQIHQTHQTRESRRSRSCASCATRTSSRCWTHSRPRPSSASSRVRRARRTVLRWC